MLDGVFGTGKTPAERIKEYNRQIKKSVREIDRERTALERQEKKLLADIKKAAKDGQMDSAKIMAKDLVRTRGYIKKMFKMKAHMEAVSLRLQTMSSSAQMAQCMKGVTKVMGKMNAKMSSANIQKIMMEFEKQNEMMGMKEEMMGDAMDDAFADEEARGGGGGERERCGDAGRCGEMAAVSRLPGHRGGAGGDGGGGGGGGAAGWVRGGGGGWVDWAYLISALRPTGSSLASRAITRRRPLRRLPRHRRPHPSADPPVAVQDSEEEEDCLLEV